MLPVLSPKSVKNVYYWTTVVRRGTKPLETLFQVDLNQLIYTMWVGQSTWSPYNLDSIQYFSILSTGKSRQALSNISFKPNEVSVSKDYIGSIFTEYCTFENFLSDRIKLQSHTHAVDIPILTATSKGSSPHLCNVGFISLIVPPIWQQTRLNTNSF